MGASDQLIASGESDIVRKKRGVFMADKGKGRARSPTGTQTAAKKKKIGDTSGQPIAALEFTESEIKHILSEAGGIMLGEGSSGRVWEGVIRSGLRDELPAQRVVVKEYDPRKPEMMALWEVERDHLIDISHPNIVKLIGYHHLKVDNGPDKKALVLEHMPGGDLESKLFKKDDPIVWEQRIGILHDVAQAMKYLHERNIIYRDLKSSNVLLDDDMNAKLTDFGAAIRGPNPPDAFVPTPNIMGSKGYTDPSYKKTGHARIEIDIYSYGVLMLEVLLGKKALHKGMELAEKINNKYKNRTLDFLLSRKLRRCLYNPKHLQSLINLAKRCLGKTSVRPTDDEILKELGDIQAIQAARRAQPGGFSSALHGLFSEDDD